MNPFEVFDICKRNLFSNIETCGGSTNFTQLGGELLGIMHACTYMNGADNGELADLLNQALAELRETREAFIAKGCEDNDTRLKGIMV